MSSSYTNIPVEGKEEERGEEGKEKGEEGRGEDGRGGQGRERRGKREDYFMYTVKRRGKM